MRNKIGVAPSVLLVVAALLIGSMGVSFAALAKNSVASKQIKNNSIKSKDIKDGQISAADLAPGTAISGPAGKNGSDAAIKEFGSYDTTQDADLGTTYASTLTRPAMVPGTYVVTGTVEVVADADTGAGVVSCRISRTAGGADLVLPGSQMAIYTPASTTGRHNMSLHGVVEISGGLGAVALECQHVHPFGEAAAIAASSMTAISVGSAIHSDAS